MDLCDLSTYQSNYCASEGAFRFSFVYIMYLNIASYFYGKHIKSKFENKLYLWLIFICVHLNQLGLHKGPKMTLKINIFVYLDLMIKGVL